MILKALANSVIKAMAAAVQAVSRREEVLWFDCDGILRDLGGRPIKQTSVSNERIRKAWERRRGC